MLNRVLIDGGPLIALFDKDDAYHSKVVNFINEGSFKFITTTAVLTEVTHMLDFHVQAQLDFLQWVLSEGVLLQDIQQEDISRIIALTEKYRDCPMDFADATLVIAAEKTGIRKIITLDSDFHVYRLPGKVNIESLLPIG